MLNSVVRCGVAFLGFSIFCFSSAVCDDGLRWEFDAAESGWMPNGQVEVSVADGVLNLNSTGNDPYLTTQAKAPAGWHKLTFLARFKGKADVQIFWTTEKDGGVAEERSIRSEFRGNESAFDEHVVFFKSDSPLTSLRFDPMSRKGRMFVQSIALTDEMPPQPKATEVKDIRVPEGFKVELLHSVDATEHGSWVSMTSDPMGRLIVSDQYGKLHRVTPPAIGSSDEVQIESINLEIGMAQGLLYAFDSLYVMVNEPTATSRGCIELKIPTTTISLTRLSGCGRSMAVVNMVLTR